MLRLAAIATRLRQDRRGVSIIELAFALPILSVMLVGLVDVATLYSAQMSLQQAASRSLERLQVNGYTNSFAFLQAEAAAAAGVPATQVAVTTWLECNNVKQPATTTACSGTAVAGKYVEVTITSSYSPFFSYSPLGTRQADGTVAMTASEAVRYG